MDPGVRRGGAFLVPRLAALSLVLGAGRFPVTSLFQVVAHVWSREGPPKTTQNPEDSEGHKREAS